MYENVRSYIVEILPFSTQCGVIHVWTVEPLGLNKGKPWWLLLISNLALCTIGATQAATTLPYL